jgi:hypothetical protein
MVQALEKYDFYFLAFSASIAGVFLMFLMREIDRAEEMP